jgi:hypothetical protein
MRTETLALGIYVLAAGVIALAVPEGKKYGNVDWINAPRLQKDYQELAKKLRVKGLQEGTSGGRSWQYSRIAFDSWWKRIEDANWIGKVPVVQESQPTEQVERPKPKPVLKPLEEIFTIAVMLAGDEGRLKIHYKDPAVRPPQPSSTSPLLAPMPNAQAQGDPMGQGTGVYQDLAIGEALYEPYQDVRFEGFSKDGFVAIFSRSAANGEERAEDRMAIAEFSMETELLSRVGEQIAGGTGGVSPTKVKSKNKIAYKDPGTQTRFDEGMGVFFIAGNDAERFRKDPGRVINEDVVTQDFVPSKAVREMGIRGGVQLRSVSPKMRSFGVSEGMILIRLNGESVTSKASALKVGRRMYDAGTRTFTATFLQNGREVNKTYRAPDK